MIERLQSSQADLAAALAAQQRFVADASHELRTPLSTIRTNAEFLRERPDAAAVDRNGAISDIVSEAERMSRVVDGLLVLARADAGIAIERRPIDLRAVAVDEARRIRPPGRVREETGMPTATSWFISEPTQAEDLIANSHVDLIELGRPLLQDPHWPYRAARELGIAKAAWTLPSPYAHWLERYRTA